MLHGECPSVRRVAGTRFPALSPSYANGQSLAYVYSRENEKAARIAKVLTEDEARRIAVNIAKLPGLLAKQSLAD